MSKSHNVSHYVTYYALQAQDVSHYVFHTQNVSYYVLDTQYVCLTM